MKILTNFVRQDVILRPIANRPAGSEHNIDRTRKSRMWAPERQP
jgi:hypothetical protein